MENLISLLSNNEKLVTAWTAIAAVFISAMSIIVTVVNVVMQRIHNRKSVLPIANIVLGDYENDLFIRLRNDGIGPMIVRTLTVTSEGSDEQVDAVIDLMPPLPNEHHWNTFVRGLSGRAISPNDYITLLALKGDLKDERYMAARQVVREALSKLTIMVTYENIYREKMPSHGRDLKWFGRHLH